VPRTGKLQVSFADWKSLQQGILLEPLLQTISDFLDDHEEMIEAVGRDLERGLRNPRIGRNGLTPQQVLRSVILMRVKNWKLSRTARTDHRRIRAAPVHGFLLPAGAQARCAGSMLLYFT
jgi:hypothetical protein